MKKYFWILLIPILVLTSCGTNGLNRPGRLSDQIENNTNINPKEGGIGGNQIVNEEDLETDINYIDIDEDKEITNSYLKSAEVKRDIVFQPSSPNANSRRVNTRNLANNISSIESAQMYLTQVPEDIDVDIRYHNYDIPYDYLLITSDNVNIYENPSLESNTLGKATLYSKVKLEGRANINNGNSTQLWYLISWLENGRPVYGYVTGDAGEPRRFRFDRMYEEIRNLEFALGQQPYGYISNYKDKNGSPPLKNGKGIDEFGIQAYQSAPAYYSLDNKDEFRYFPDGMIVFILDEAENYFKVRNLAYEGEYWIPKNYISFDDNLDRLDKVVVVDKSNQNQALFENRNGRWTLISYTLATTGVPAEGKYETPTGSFKVLQKRERFYYLNHKTKEIGGYAPYGTRFSAGAYIHGIPVDYVEKDGEAVDPGMKEYLLTIGTTPRSAKCVRNYTSHAKFVYDWSDLNDTAVIIID